MTMTMTMTEIVKYFIKMWSVIMGKEGEGEEDITFMPHSIFPLGKNLFLLLLSLSI